MYFQCLLSGKTLAAQSWLSNKVKLYGDSMPDKEEIQLPQCIKKRHLFDDYLKEKKKNGRPYICQSKFYGLWREAFKHVKTPKVCTFSLEILC